MSVEVRGQLAGNDSLLPPSGVLGLGSKCLYFLAGSLELFLPALMTVWIELFKRLGENWADKSHRLPLSCMWSLLSWVSDLLVKSRTVLQLRKWEAG